MAQQQLPLLAKRLQSLARRSQRRLLQRKLNSDKSRIPYTASKTRITRSSMLVARVTTGNECRHIV